MENNPDNDFSANLKKEAYSLSEADFENIGMNQIAYIRKFTDANDNEVYGLYAANGVRISVIDSVEMAHATAQFNDLQPVKLH